MKFSETRGKMSVNSHYLGLCCGFCVNPEKWAKRSKFKTQKKTLRTHRTGK